MLARLLNQLHKTTNTRVTFYWLKKPDQSTTADTLHRYKQLCRLLRQVCLILFDFRLLQISATLNFRPFNFRKQQSPFPEVNGNLGLQFQLGSLGCVFKRYGLGTLEMAIYCWKIDPGNWNWTPPIPSLRSSDARFETNFAYCVAHSDPIPVS